MAQKFTGNVEAVCPRCKQSIESDSVPGQTVAEVRMTIKRIAASFRRLYPFAKIKTIDPLEPIEAES